MLQVLQAGTQAGRQAGRQCARVGGVGGAMRPAPCTAPCPVRLASWQLEAGGGGGGDGGAQQAPERAVRRAALAPSRRWALQWALGGADAGKRAAHVGGMVALQLPPPGGEAAVVALPALCPPTAPFSSAFLRAAEGAGAAAAPEERGPGARGEEGAAAVPGEALLLLEEGGLRALCLSRTSSTSTPTPASSSSAPASPVHPTERSCRGACWLPWGEEAVTSTVLPGGSAVLAELLGVDGEVACPSVLAVHSCRDATAAVLRLRCSPRQRPDASVSEIESDTDSSASLGARPRHNRLSSGEGASLLALRGAELVPAGCVALIGDWLSGFEWADAEVCGTALLLLDEHTGDVLSWPGALQLGSSAVLQTPPVRIANPASTARAMGGWCALAVATVPEGDQHASLALMSTGVLTVSTPIDDLLTVDSCDGNGTGAEANDVRDLSERCDADRAPAAAAARFWCDGAAPGVWHGGPGRAETMARRADAAAALAARAEAAHGAEAAEWEPLTAFAAGGVRRMQRAAREGRAAGRRGRWLSSVADAGGRRMLVRRTPHPEAIDTLLVPSEGGRVAIVAVSRATGLALSVEHHRLRVDGTWATHAADGPSASQEEESDASCDVSSLGGVACCLGSSVYLLAPTTLIALLPRPGRVKPGHLPGLLSMLEHGSGGAALAVATLNGWGEGAVAECALERALGAARVLDNREELTVVSEVSRALLPRERLRAVLGECARTLDFAVGAGRAIPAFRKLLRATTDASPFMRGMLLQLGARASPRAILATYERRNGCEERSGAAGELGHYLVLIRRLLTRAGDTKGLHTPPPHRSSSEAPHTAPADAMRSDNRAARTLLRGPRRALFGADARAATSCNRQRDIEHGGDVGDNAPGALDEPQSSTPSPQRGQSCAQLKTSFAPWSGAAALIARWGAASWTATEVVQEALLTNRLTTAIAYLLDREGEVPSAARVIDIGRGLAYSFLWEGGEARAVATLLRSGDDATTSLRTLRRTTVYRRMRHLVSGTLASLDEPEPSDEHDLQLWDAVDRLEALYPSDNYARACSEAGLGVSSGELTCGDVGVSDERSARCEPWQLADEGTALCLSPVHDSGHGSYLCVAATWVQGWDIATLARVEMEGRASALAAAGAEGAWLPTSDISPNAWAAGAQMLAQRFTPHELAAWIGAVPAECTEVRELLVCEENIRAPALRAGLWRQITHGALPSQRAVAEAALLRAGVLSDPMLTSGELMLSVAAGADLISADGPWELGRLGGAKTTFLVAKLRLPRLLSTCVRWHGAGEAHGMISGRPWAAWQALAQWKGHSLQALLENLRWHAGCDAYARGEELLAMLAAGRAGGTGGALSALCVLVQARVDLDVALAPSSAGAPTWPAPSIGAESIALSSNALHALTESHPLLWRVVDACASRTSDGPPMPFRAYQLAGLSPIEGAHDSEALLALQYTAWKKRQFVSSGADASLVELVRARVPAPVTALLEAQTEGPVGDGGGGIVSGTTRELAPERSELAPERSGLALIHEWEAACWGDIERTALPDSVPPDSPINELESLLLQGRATAALELALTEDGGGARSRGSGRQSAGRYLLIASARAAAAHAFNDDRAVAAAVLAALLAGDEDAATSIRCDVAGLRRVAITDAPRATTLAVALRDAFAAQASSSLHTPAATAAAGDLVSALLELRSFGEGIHGVGSMALPAAVARSHGIDERVVVAHLDRVAASDDWLSVLSEAEALRLPRSAVLDVIERRAGAHPGEGALAESAPVAWWRSHAARALGVGKATYDASQSHPAHELLSLAARVENGSMDATELILLCRKLCWPVLAVAGAALGSDVSSAAAAWMFATVGGELNDLTGHTRKLAERCWLVLQPSPTGDGSAAVSVNAKLEVAAATSALCASGVHAPVARAFEIFRPCDVLEHMTQAVRSADSGEDKGVVGASLKRAHEVLEALVWAHESTSAVADGTADDGLSGALDSQFESVVDQVACHAACVGVMCVVEATVAQRSVWSGAAFVDALAQSPLVGGHNISMPHRVARAISRVIVRFRAMAALAELGENAARARRPLADALVQGDAFDEALLARLVRTELWDAAFALAAALDEVFETGTAGSASLDASPTKRGAEGEDGAPTVACVRGPRGARIAAAAASKLLEDWREWLGDSADDSALWEEVSAVFTLRGVAPETAGLFALREADLLASRGASASAERAAASAAYEWLKLAPAGLADGALEALQRRVWLLGAEGAATAAREAGADGSDLVLLATWRLLEDGQVGAAARLCAGVARPRELALCEAATAAATSPALPAQSLPSLGEAALAHVPEAALMEGVDALAAVEAIGAAIERGKGRAYVDAVGAALAAGVVLGRSFPEIMSAEPQRVLEQLLRCAASESAATAPGEACGNVWPLCLQYAAAHALRGASAADALSALLLEGSLGGQAPRGAPCRRLAALVRSSAKGALLVATRAGTTADEVAHALVRRTLERRQQLTAAVEAMSLSVAARLYQGAGARGLEGADVLLAIAIERAGEWADAVQSERQAGDDDGAAVGMTALARLGAVMACDARPAAAAIAEAVVRADAAIDTLREFDALASATSQEPYVAVPAGARAGAPASPSSPPVAKGELLRDSGRRDSQAPAAGSAAASLRAALFAAAECVGGAQGAAAGAALRAHCGFRLVGEACRDAALRAIAAVAGEEAAEQGAASAQRLHTRPSSPSPATPVASPSPIAALKARLKSSPGDRADRAAGRATLASAARQMSEAAEALADAGCTREASRCRLLSAAAALATGELASAPLRLSARTAAQWLQALVRGDGAAAFRFACVAGGRAPAIAAVSLEACAGGGAWLSAGDDTAALGMSLRTLGALQQVFDAPREGEPTLEEQAALSGLVEVVGEGLSPCAQLLRSLADGASAAADVRVEALLDAVSDRTLALSLAERLTMEDYARIRCRVRLDVWSALPSPGAPAPAAS